MFLPLFVQVTEAVVDVVSNTMEILSDVYPATLVGLSALPVIVRSLETQVESTFHARGALSVQREFIHVETISVSTSQAENGFSLAVIQSDQQAPSPTPSMTTRSTLIGTEVVLFDNDTAIPSNETVRAVITLPKLNMSAYPTRGKISLIKLSPIYPTQAFHYRATSRVCYGSANHNARNVLTIHQNPALYFVDNFHPL